MKTKIRNLLKKKRLYTMLFLAALIVFLAWYIQCLPEKPFRSPASTLLYDSEGTLLAGRIAKDGQWRFPECNSVPFKFETCILNFEDKYFYSHHGVSLRSLARAVKQNISMGKIVSGGSTITMQVVRLMRKNPRRTFVEKIREMFIATRLEFRYSKKEILALYASHAPFGGNVVGLEAASWRYFGRSADLLSWAEAATLAVLPNAPGLIYPGKNQEKLLKKRNRLLLKLHDKKIISRTDYDLAIREGLPGKPFELPKAAVHLLNFFIKSGMEGKNIRSTLQRSTQDDVMRVLEKHQQRLRENGINNASALVISVKRGEVEAYVGNTTDPLRENGGDVDVIRSPRSTGSILKPLLYANMLNDGKITPQTLIPDVPTSIGGYNPKNYSQQFDGAVPASRALARSLNIPAVRMLNDYGVEKFYRRMKKMGVSTLYRPSSEYGLSLILGGAEATLWDLGTVYYRMAKQLNHYPHIVSSMNLSPLLIKPDKLPEEKTDEPLLNAAAIYSTFEAMVEVNRPGEENNWKAFPRSGKIAWKTGTSFGFRDGWAVGITPDYVVAVWTGNADGEGRSGLTGIDAAAPVLFDLFSLLPKSPWFKKPEAEFVPVKLCRASGHRASEVCSEADTVSLPITCLPSASCPYHRMVHLDRSGKYRADSECEDVSRLKHVSWFVLPPLMEKFYRFKNPSYVPLPDFLSGCSQKLSEKTVSILYPQKGSRIEIPPRQDGSPGKTIFEAILRKGNGSLHWHLDEMYIGSTQEVHQVELAPGAGKHVLSVQDENGVTARQEFWVVEGE